MKQGPQIATAVAIGYVLGRSRKMKLALMMGGLVLGQRMGDPKELLAKAGEAVARSDEVGELGSVLRDRLVDAAKTAAVAAASNKLDSLGDNLSERAAKIRSPQSESAESDDEDQESASSGQEPESSEQQAKVPEQQTKEAKTPKQRSSTDDQAAQSGKRTRAPRKPSAPRAASTAPRKKAAASSSGSRRRSGGNDG